MLTEELIQKFHKFSEKGKPYDVVDARISNYIIEKNNLMIISGKPFYYANGVYREDKNGVKVIRCRFIRIENNQLRHEKQVTF